MPVRSLPDSSAQSGRGEVATDPAALVALFNSALPVAHKLAVRAARDAAAQWPPREFTVGMCDKDNAHQRQQRKRDSPHSSVAVLAASVRQTLLAGQVAPSVARDAGSVGGDGDDGGDGGALGRCELFVGPFEAVWVPSDGSLSQSAWGRVDDAILQRCRLPPPPVASQLADATCQLFVSASSRAAHPNPNSPTRTGKGEPGVWVGGGDGMMYTRAPSADDIDVDVDLDVPPLPSTMGQDSRSSPSGQWQVPLRQACSVVAWCAAYLDALAGAQGGVTSANHKKEAVSVLLGGQSDNPGVAVEVDMLVPTMIMPVGVAVARVLERFFRQCSPWGAC